jgi:anti-sigma factor RsiW
MTCAELETRLQAYAHGTLPAPEAAALEAHLSGCAQCARLLEAMEPAPVGLAALPRSIPPDRDLWTSIEQRIRPRARRIAVPAWLLAAAAILLVAFSSGVTLLLVRPAPTAAVAAGEALAPLEAQYASAATDLSHALDQARQRLSPETIRTIERNLAVIDSALAESRRALAGDPGNASLERLVIATWQQKMDFLRRATALPARS